MPVPLYKAEGAGRPECGRECRGGRREKPQSAPLGCGVTAALAAWFGRNPRKAPLEMSQLLARRDTQPGRPPRLHASSCLCQRSVQGRRELKCLAGLPSPRHVAKADLSACPAPSLPTDLFPGTGSAPCRRFVTLASVTHLSQSNLGKSHSFARLSVNFFPYFRTLERSRADPSVLFPGAGWRGRTEPIKLIVPRNFGK